MYTGERNTPSIPLYEARKRVLKEREARSWGLMDFIGGLVTTVAIGTVGLVVVMGIAAGIVWWIF